jgi:biopolymer transport protein ExbB
MDGLWQSVLFLARGGPVMVPLALASVICLAFVVERWISLRRGRIVPGNVVDALDGLLREKKVTEALALARASDTALGRIAVTGLSNLSMSRKELEETLEGAGRREAKDLERFLDYLSMLAAVAPLLGLLGTVTGMINAFLVVHGAGLGDPLKLTAGIAEALICTAAGLVVAIPALVAHRYFLHRIDRFVLELEETAARILGLAGSG